MTNYLISISNSDAFTDGIIHHPKSKLKVKAFDPLKSGVNPGNGEIMYFVTTAHQTLAFVTTGYKRHHQLLILHMIAWYCVYLGLIGAQIHSTLPLTLGQAS